MTSNINEMSINTLLYNFQGRMRRLLQDQVGMHQMDAEPGWILDLIENEIMPHVDKIVDWEPTDDEITANNSCGTAWHDGCR